jgi:photosystem II stability/assembly factor-like uncharacterized protein
VYAIKQNPLRSQDGGVTWVRMDVGLPRGTRSFDLAIDPVLPDTLYLATDHGVFKSTGRGSWKRASAGLPAGEARSLAIDPRPPVRLFALSHSGVLDQVYQSTDAGLSWQPLSAVLPQGLVPVQLAVHPLQPENLYLTTSWAGIFEITLSR